MLNHPQFTVGMSHEPSPIGMRSTQWHFPLWLNTNDTTGNKMFGPCETDIMPQRLSKFLLLSNSITTVSLSLPLPSWQNCGSYQKFTASYWKATKGAKWHGNAIKKLLEVLLEESSPVPAMNQHPTKDALLWTTHWWSTNPNNHKRG